MHHTALASLFATFGLGDLQGLVQWSQESVFMEGGGLLFIPRPFIHVIAGLAKGEMSLTEFCRTAILLNALLSPFRGQETSDMRPSSSVLEGRMSLIAMESSEGYSPEVA